MLSPSIWLTYMWVVNNQLPVYVRYQRVALVCKTDHRSTFMTYYTSDIYFDVQGRKTGLERINS